MTSSTESNPKHAANRMVRMGVITSPHGIRGQVKIRSFTANPDDITAYGPLTDQNGKVWKVNITSNTTEVLIATIDGITTREQAEGLRNLNLFVPRSALPKTKQNQYYHEDLVGLKVKTVSGENFGTITAMHNFGAGELAEIRLVNGKEELYPFNRITFPAIDIDNGIAVIEPPVYMPADESSAHE